MKKMAYPINESHNDKTEEEFVETSSKLNKMNCLIINCFIIYIFVLCTINNVQKYLHIRISRYILIYSNILYFISFWSLNNQVELLIGTKDGLLPLDMFLKDIEKKLSLIHFFVVYKIIIYVHKFWKTVTLKKIKVTTVCKFGIGVSVLNFVIQKNVQNDIFRIFLTAHFFVILFFLHLSFKVVLRDFMIFQCDLLMNEFGLILIFLSLNDSYYLIYSNTLIICILRLLVFKLLFSAATQKYVHGECQWLQPEWNENFFLTHPIPSYLSYVGNRMLNRKLICTLLFFSEVFFSWFSFCPFQFRAFLFIIFCGVHLTCFILCNQFFSSYICLLIFSSLFDDSIFESVLNTVGNGSPFSEVR